MEKRAAVMKTDMKTDPCDTESVWLPISVLHCWLSCSLAPALQLISSGLAVSRAIPPRRFSTCKHRLLPRRRVRN